MDYSQIGSFSKIDLFPSENIVSLAFSQDPICYYAASMNTEFGVCNTWGEIYDCGLTAPKCCSVLEQTSQYQVYYKLSMWSD